MSQRRYTATHRAEIVDQAKYMREIGYTRTAVAAHAGVHADTLRYWECPEVHDSVKKRCREWARANYKYDPEYQRKYRGTLAAHCKNALAVSKYKERTEGYAACTATADELQEAFTGGCHICGVPETECTHRLSMDHCHATGKFRGWLCSMCNNGLGSMKDDPTVLREAANYLEIRGAA